MTTTTAPQRLKVSESGTKVDLQSGLTTKIVTEYEGLEALKWEWESLLEDSNQPSFFLRWDWVRLWWLTCSPDASHLFLITCRDDLGRLVGLAPFYRRRRTVLLIPGVREILFIGTGTAVKSSEYTDIIARKGHEIEVARVLTLTLKNCDDWDRLWLNELPDGSRVLPLMAAATSGKMRFALLGRTHYIKTDSAGQEFVQTLGKSMRQSLSRRTRHLLSRHHCCFIQVQRPSELEAALDDLIHLHQARWNSIGQPGSFSLPGFDAFLKEAARFSLQKDLLRLWVLKIDSRPAAAVLAFFHNGVAHYFQGGFDPEYSKYSIGTVMLGLCIQACIADPEVSEFDFMGGNDPYKDRWTRSTRGVYSAVWTRPSVRTVALTIQESALAVLKTTARLALPPSVRTRLNRKVPRSLVRASIAEAAPCQVLPTQTASSPEGRDFQCQVLDGPGAIDALEREWDALLDEVDDSSFFLRWQWTRAWWTRYAPPGSKPFIIACRDSRGRLVGLAPLYCRQVRTLALSRVKELFFIGTGIPMRSSEYLDIIALRGSETEVCGAIAATLGASRDWDRLSLRELHARSRTATLLAEKLGSNAQISISGRSHYVDTSVNWDAFRMSLGKSTRDNIARYTRRLFTQHRCRFARVETPEGLKPALDALVRLHQARWKQKGHRGSFALPHFEDFLRTTAAVGLEDGSLRLWTLEIDSRIAAVLVGFLHKGVVHAFQTGFDPAYSKHSLGTVMVSLCIRACVDEPGVNEFDFMGGDDPYKDKWTSRRTDTLTLILERRNARTRVLSIEKKSTEAALSLLRALAPAPIRAAARRKLSAHWAS